MNIELSLAPREAELNRLSLGIKAFNQQHLPRPVVYEADKRFALFARNEAGRVIGGIRANGFWNYAIIELFWLDESVRGQGLGSALIRELEQHAKQSGYEYVRTETLDFQAKGFYQKQGYQVYGEIPDCPKGHTAYCLLKAL